MFFLVWLPVFWGLCRALPWLGHAGTPNLDQSPLSYRGPRLHGRFLHVTDIHPDPFYKVYSSTAKEAACHRHSGPAGVYGAETSGCDSPISLVNATFKWIDENIKDTIDFVVWTGDSARHDNDEKIPRSEAQVLEQNRFIVSKFLEVFGKPENWNDTDPTNDFAIPIIPTFGNNDVMPHNIFREGPNEWTQSYLDVWRQFIPEAQRHQFQRGGWFYVEVIPNRLAIFSMNTLYFFDSNSAVDGCAAKSEPGYEQMEWLRIQLQLLRERGMKAILIGHVPPARTDNKMSWDESCWQKYALWMKQYRDIIVGAFYGHMNIDHFILQDSKEIHPHVLKGQVRSETAFHAGAASDDEISISSANDYLVDLRKLWAALPGLATSLNLDEDHGDGGRPANYQGSGPQGKGDAKSKKKKILDEIGGRWGERFSVSLVAPSVIPNYFPTLRVVEYNISGLEGIPLFGTPFASELTEDPQSLEAPDDEGPLTDQGRSKVDVPSQRKAKDAKHKDKKKKKKKKGRKGRKKSKKHKFTVPEPPSKSSPPGPAYSSQTFTLLGYTQYYANLTMINNDFHAAESENLLEDARWKEGKHHGKHPTGKDKKAKPKEFQFQVEYDTFSDKVFKMKDLTVRSYIELARRIGDTKKHKKSSISPAEISDAVAVSHQKKKKKKSQLWFTFVQRALVGTMDSEEIEQQFGRSKGHRAASFPDQEEL